MFKNKKGEALPLNVIIIAIIVIVVLVVVLLIFIGGIGGLQGKFQSKADDQVLASRECESFCNNIRDETNSNTIKSSGYCNTYYKFDKNNDGKVDTTDDGKNIRFYCGGQSNSAGSTLDYADATGVGISCPVECLTGKSAA